MLRKQTILRNTVLPVAPVLATMMMAMPHSAYAQSSGSGDACTAVGAKLSIAKRNYANACPSLPREDCDPLSDGSWLCSSENIVGVTGTTPSPEPTVEPEPPMDPEPAVEPEPPVVVGACTAEGGSLRRARRNYANACPSIPRVDCDLLSNGRWICSSETIGTTPVEDPIEEPTPIEDPIVIVDPDPDPDPDPGTNPNPSQVGFVSVNDLVALHFDNCPDRDDGHAVVAGRAVLDTVGITNFIVVNGTCGTDIRDDYQPDSEAVLNATFGDDWLDGFNDLTQSVNTAADRWAATLANGDDVWVQEGGPSDFTGMVLRRIGDVYPSVDRGQVHVVQHAAGAGFNERNTESDNIDLIEEVADYITLSNGNRPNNGTADLNMQSTFFVNIALESRFSSAYEAAFDYLDPIEDKLDFSDTVELLYIVDDTDTQTVDDFASRYLQ